MAARSPRKIFASPFVVTLAAACGPAAPPPQQPVPSQPTPAEPTPAPTPTVVIANPPHPAPASETLPVSYDQRWTVMKSGADCHAMPKVDCPKPAQPGGPMPTCNPPPPIKYACPEGWDGTSPMKIVQYANSTECLVEAEPIKCPPNASCNPPAPRRVACPR